MVSILISESGGLRFNSGWASTLFSSYYILILCRCLLDSLSYSLSHSQIQQCFQQWTLVLTHTFLCIDFAFHKNALKLLFKNVGLINSLQYPSFALRIDFEFFLAFSCNFLLQSIEFVVDFCHLVYTIT